MAQLAWLRDKRADTYAELSRLILLFYSQDDFKLPSEYLGLQERLRSIDILIAIESKTLEIERTFQAKVKPATPFYRSLKTTTLKRNQWVQRPVESVADMTIPPELPVPVMEVESLPSNCDHMLSELLQKKANALINWNYHSLGLAPNRSRRYEGFRR